MKLNFALLRTIFYNMLATTSRHNIGTISTLIVDVTISFQLPFLHETPQLLSRMPLNPYLTYQLQSFFPMGPGRS
jgi:hypothetical protein